MFLFKNKEKENCIYMYYLSYVFCIGCFWDSGKMECYPEKSTCSEYTGVSEHGCNSDYNNINTSLILNFLNKFFFVLFNFFFI